MVNVTEFGNFKINPAVPWNGECEICYGKHPFKQGEWFFRILHPWSPDSTINVCQICWFVSNGKLISKHQYNHNQV